MKKTGYFLIALLLLTASVLGDWNPNHQPKMVPTLSQNTPIGVNGTAQPYDPSPPNQENGGSTYHGGGGGLNIPTVSCGRVIDYPKYTVRIIHPKDDYCWGKQVKLSGSILNGERINYIQIKTMK